MKQPEGFPQGSPGDVLHLQRPLYGLKQGPKLWHEKLDEVLTSIGFVKINSDASVGLVILHPCRSRDCYVTCVGPMFRSGSPSMGFPGFSPYMAFVLP